MNQVCERTADCGDRGQDHKYEWERGKGYLTYIAPWASCSCYIIIDV